MEPLPFERLERVESALTEAALPGLLMVFSKAASDDLLLVYLSVPPAPRPAHHLAITLDDLPTADLVDYDGPILGLEPVALIRPDVPTIGPLFCRLDSFLRECDRVALLRRTWAGLADALVDQLADAPTRWGVDGPGDRAGDGADDGADQPLGHALAEIAAIRSPERIAALPAGLRQGMVAFLPDSGRAIRLDGGPLDRLGATGVRRDDTVIALEEVLPLLHPAATTDAPDAREGRDPREGQDARETEKALDRPPIELRTLLRRSELDLELPATLRALARGFHRRWEATGSVADRATAYALALEIQLADTDVDDLSAVVPVEDFEAFLVRGAGLYVYRRPLEAGSLSARSDVRRLWLDDARAELSATSSPVTFSLLPLRRLLTASAAPSDRWCDLGPVLRRAGRSEVLGRNAWLLVQDLLDASRDRRREYLVTPQSLLETMVHCCALFSLTDPWKMRQGRRNEWLLEAYDTLHRVLRLLAETDDEERPRDYYRALARWYACALVPPSRIAESLDGMVTSLDRLSALTARYRRPDPVVAEDARALAAIGRALLDLLRGGARAEAYRDLIRPRPDTNPQVVARAADMSRPMELLSPPFARGLHRYTALADAVRRVKASQIPVRDKIDQLTVLGNELRQARRLVYAPHHQARILDRLYETTIDETRDLVLRLVGSAALDVELKTRAIAPDRQDAGIVLAVTNMGSVRARDVEIELAASEGFALLDQSFKRTLPQLAAEQTQSFRFSVRSLTEADTLPVRCTVSYSDSGPERQQRTFEFRMRVVGVDRGPFRQKPNPYVFGLPLQEPHQFYGRRGELEQMLAHLAIRRPQNVLLRGARRTGKTSLLYMVRAVLSDADGRSGVRRWFDIPSAWHPALDATVPVILDLQALDWCGGRPTPTGFYQGVIGALAEAGLRGPMTDLLLEEPSVTGTQFSLALRGVLRDSGGVRPVMLVDEFDILDRIAEKSFFYGPLRHVISTVQGVTWVVASALGLYNEVRDYESPLFNVFKIIDLALLDPDAARRLILSPWEPGRDRREVSRLSRLQFADDAVETILDESGCYPYFIQLLCSEIVDHLNATQTGYVHHRTVLQVIERRMLAEGSAAAEHFAYLWDRAGGAGKLILLELLHHPGALGRGELRDSVLYRLLPHATATTALGATVAAAFDDSLQRLVVVDAVRRVPGGGFAFGIPLFRRLLLKRNDREDLERAALDELAQPAGADDHG